MLLGSGKSTMVQELEARLESEMAQQDQQEGGSEDKKPPLFLIKVSLPSLKNPLTGLYDEALAKKGLTVAQRQELRELAQRGEVRLVLLLDAYDELRHDCQKNLFMTNNLELCGFRQEEGKKVPDGGAKLPVKVIITTRTELLSQMEAYHHLFVPMEADNPEKDTEEKALEFLKEVRIAEFTNQLEAYVMQRCALTLRAQFVSRVGHLDPLAQGAADLLKMHALKEPDERPEPAAKDQMNDDSITGPSQDMLVEAACEVLTSASGGHEEVNAATRTNLMTGLRDSLSSASHSENIRHWHVLQTASVMAASLQVPVSDVEKLKAPVDDFCKVAANDSSLWLFRDYMEAFKEIPELKDLTTTPFMVEIVTDILPELKGSLQSSDADKKARLLQILSEPAAHAAWGCITQWPSKHGGQAILMEEGKQVPQDLVDDVAAALRRSSGKSLSQEKRLKAIAQMHLKSEGSEKDWSEKHDEHIFLEVELVLGGLLGDAEHDDDHEVCNGDEGRKSLADEARRGDGPARGSASSQANATAAPGRQNSSEQIVATTTDVPDEAVVERAIKEHALRHALENALRRPPVLRSRVYDLFTARHMEHEARKASVAGAASAEDIKREARAYSERLAMAMTVENVTKVATTGSSALFREASVWDPFLSGPAELEGLRLAAMKAAPLRTGISLAFLHKVGPMPHPAGNNRIVFSKRLSRAKCCRKLRLPAPCRRLPADSSGAPVCCRPAGRIASRFPGRVCPAGCREAHPDHHHRIRFCYGDKAAC